MASHDNQQWITVSHKKHKPDKEKNVIQLQSNYKPAELDTTEIIIRKKPQKPLKSQITKVEKHTSPNSQKASNLSHHHRKIESADGEDSLQQLQYYSPKFRARLINLRLKLNLTRKEFAQKLNVKECVIKGIENNTEIYDPNIMSRLCTELQRLET